jgi:hypothetical protein
VLSLRRARSDNRPGPGLELLEVRALLSATQLALVSPPGVTAGTPFAVAVTAEDAQGDVATDYTGTVHFSSSDTAAVLPADYTFTATDAGEHVFLVQLQTAGTSTLRVADTAGVVTPASATVSVVSATGQTGPIDHFTVTAPATAVAGSPFSVTVTAKDAAGNTLTNYAGKIHFQSSEDRGEQPPDHTFTAADQGTFTATYALPRTGPVTITVTSSDPGQPSGHATVTIVPTPAAQLVLSTASRATPGAQVAVTVQALDQYGNAATGYTGTVHFTSSDAGAQLPADTTFTAADAGSVTLPATFQTAGDQTLTAADPANGSLSAVAYVKVRYADGNENYVNSVYQDLLGRAADAGGLAYWGGLLDHGTSRAAVVQAVEGSGEYLQGEVGKAFNNLLGRDPDAGALGYFTGQLASGVSIDDVKVALMSTDEYYQQRGAGLDEGFLASVFADVLNRNIDPGDLKYYRDLLANGTSRADVVRMITTSTEAEQGVASGLYASYLHRAADPAGVNYFVGALQGGGHSEQVMNFLLTSDEYFAQASA